jgi:hypothetical protein
LQPPFFERKAWRPGLSSCSFFSKVLIASTGLRERYCYTVGRREGLREWINHVNFSFPTLISGQMGFLLLSVVVTSQPEIFQLHLQELLRLLNDTLSEVGSPGLLFYSLRTLTTMAPYLSTDDVVRCWPSPPLTVSSGLHVLVLAGFQVASDSYPAFNSS